MWGNLAGRLGGGDLSSTLQKIGNVVAPPNEIPVDDYAEGYDDNNDSGDDEDGYEDEDVNVRTGFGFVSMLARALDDRRSSPKEEDGDDEEEDEEEDYECHLEEDEGEIIDVNQQTNFIDKSAVHYCESPTNESATPVSISYNESSAAKSSDWLPKVDANAVSENSAYEHSERIARHDSTSQNHQRLDETRRNLVNQDQQNQFLLEDRKHEFPRESDIPGDSNSSIQFNDVPRNITKEHARTHRAQEVIAQQEQESVEGSQKTESGEREGQESHGMKQDFATKVDSRRTEQESQLREWHDFDRTSCEGTSVQRTEQTPMQRQQESKRLEQEMVRHQWEKEPMNTVFKGERSGMPFRTDEPQLMEEAECRKLASEEDIPCVARESLEMDEIAPFKTNDALTQSDPTSLESISKTKPETAEGGLFGSEGGFDDEQGNQDEKMRAAAFEDRHMAAKVFNQVESNKQLEDEKYHRSSLAATGNLGAMLKVDSQSDFQFSEENMARSELAERYRQLEDKLRLAHDRLEEANSTCLIVDMLKLKCGQLEQQLLEANDQVASLQNEATRVQKNMETLLEQQMITFQQKEARLLEAASEDYQHEITRMQEEFQSQIHLQK